MVYRLERGREDPETQLKKGGQAMGERICPYCDAHLDPDEKCDCQGEEQ